MQTIPPFDYGPNNTIKWEDANNYILSELSKKVDMVFDVVSLLQESKEHPQKAKYGGHSNAEGSAIWADALYKALIQKNII